MNARQVEILEAFAEAQRLGKPSHFLPFAWHWMPDKALSDRSEEIKNTIMRERVKTVENYKARLLAGERPVFKRPCDRARCKLWHVAARAVGVEI